MGWVVYILRCADDSLYTGITTDIQRRTDEHNGIGKKKGARYTHNRRPVTLVYQENHVDRSQASKREIEIKSLSREQKFLLFEKLTSTNE